MIEFLWWVFLIPFNVFVWTIQYLGSFLVWVGIGVWVYQSRSSILDWISDRWFDLMYWFRNRKKSTKNDEKPEDYIV